MNRETMQAAPIIGLMGEDMDPEKVKIVMAKVEELIGS